MFQADVNEFQMLIAIDHNTEFFCFFQAEVAQKEAIQRNTPELALPLTLLPDNIPEVVPYESSANLEPCQMFNCWDFSRCSITSGFPIYFYEVYFKQCKLWKIEFILKLVYLSIFRVVNLR